MDLSLDLDENAFKKKSRKGVVVGAVLGILAVFGGILVANRAHLGSGGDTTAAAAARAPPPAAPPPATADTPAPAPPPAPVATTAACRREREQADRRPEGQARRGRQGPRGRSPRRTRRAAPLRAEAATASPKYKSQGFTTGGNKFDPLNASL